MLVTSGAANDQFRTSNWFRANKQNDISNENAYISRIFDSCITLKC